MTRTAFRLAEPVPLSPARQALADALAEAAPFRTIADEARARAEAARGVLASALGAVPAAERAAETAKARLIENPQAPRAELRALRQAVADAVDDLAIAREVSERADDAEVAAERSARYAAEGVERAADVVVASSFPAAIEAAEHAARHAARLAFAASEIGAHGNNWNGERSLMVNRVDCLNPQFAFRSDGTAAALALQEAAAPWRAAYAALLSDPAAPLPEVK